MANSWYFDEYGDKMIRNYKRELIEYQKKSGKLPHEEDDFKNILIEPKDYAEAVFAAKCFLFLKDATDFLNQLDRKLQEKGESLQTRNKLKYRFQDVSLGWGTENIIRHYLSKLYGYRPDLGIKDELTVWVTTELQRILQEPKTEAEVYLCQKYIECLAEKEAEAKRQQEAKEAQERRIQQYLDRLQNRQGIYDKLKRAGHTHSMLLDILWNPTTQEELDFCISYFGFQDDIKFISEAAKEGKVTKPNIGVTSDVMFFGDYYFEQPTNQAKTLYDLTVLEQTDHEALMKLLQEKGEYPSLPTEEYEHFKEYLDAQIIKGISREEIAKGLSSKPLGRFNAFAQDLHQRYLTGMSYEDATPTTLTPTSSKRTKEDEVREYAEQQGYQYIKTLME